MVNSTCSRQWWDRRSTPAACGCPWRGTRICLHKVKLSSVSTARGALPVYSAASPGYRSVWYRPRHEP
jgi:hypothetical protein